MAILNNNPLVGASGNQGGYNINNSLRFRSSATAYLSRTPSSSGNRQKWTWSGWVKRGALSDTMLFHCQISSTDKVQCRIDSNHNIAFLVRIGNVSGLLITSRVLRDPSAWYHIMFVCDTTQATATTQFKIYVNGVEETSFSSSSATTQNGNSAVNSTTSHQIGYDVPNASSAFDGYLAETYLIDGQALTPSSFGETDTTTGVWKPKAYTGTYGTNGFYLKFSDIATTSGSNAGLGKDFSGNTNYWTTNNISVTSGTTYDAMTDSPTLTSATVANYATLNPIQTATANITWANANLQASLGTTAAWRTAISTMAVDSGKWYAEFTVTTGVANNSAIGIVPVTDSYSGSYLPGSTAGSYGYPNDGTKYNNGSNTSYGSSWTTGDIIGIAYDGTNNKIWFSKNGTWQASGDPAAGTNAAFTTTSGVAYYFAVAGATSTQSVFNCNFGQRPFSYTPPTGFNRLNTFNLPDSTIKKGNSYMDATLFTGNNSANTITNAAGFKPDFVWTKSRVNAYNHDLYDSVRGINKTLFSNSTNAESTLTNTLTSFNSNGFTLGVNDDANFVNGSAAVAWQWQAGQGTTSSNTSGSITSTVSVNTTAGFSVVTYTGNGTSGATVGHGLGVAPKMIIAKGRGNVDNWPVYHASANASPATGHLLLNTTAAFTSTSSTWNNTAPTSTVFSIGTDTRINQNTIGYVAYCFAEISGYSKFGSYTGNGSADGPFVFCNFRPKFVMIKRTVNAGGSWAIYDSSRNTYNVANLSLYPNLSNADDTYDVLDFTSNGFKIRTSSLGVNQSGDTFIVAAFAESPFKNSNAR